MIELRDTYEHLYLNSCLDTNSVYYVELGETPTKHLLNFDIKEYCQAEVIDSLKSYIAPLAFLDLNELNPDFQDKFPLFYHENTMMDWVVSQLDDNGKVSDCYLLDYEGKRFDFKDFGEDEEEEFFEEGAEEIQNSLEDLSNHYLNIWQEKPLEPLGKIDHSEGEKYEEWAHQNSVSYMNRDEDSEYPNHYGPLPWKMQSNFTIPLDPETKEDLVFLGQINSGLFGLCDFTYFLFYNARKNVVAQMMQMT